MLREYEKIAYTNLDAVALAQFALRRIKITLIITRYNSAKFTQLYLFHERGDLCFFARQEFFPKNQKKMMAFIILIRKTILI